MNRSIRFIGISLMMLILANWSAEKSKENAQVCAGTVSFYKGTRTSDLVDVTLGSSKGNSTSGRITFYIPPARVTMKIKKSDLVSRSWKLSQIREMRTVGSEFPEISTIDRKDYINIEVDVRLKDGGVQTVRCMLDSKTKIFGKVRKTGSEDVYPLASVTKLTLYGCIEEGVEVNLKQMCAAYDAQGTDAKAGKKSEAL